MNEAMLNYFQNLINNLLFVDVQTNILPFKRTNDCAFKAKKFLYRSTILDIIFFLCFVEQQADKKVRLPGIEKDNLKYRVPHKIISLSRKFLAETLFSAQLSLTGCLRNIFI